MAAEAAAANPAAPQPAPSGPSKLPLLLALVNTLVVMAALGFLTYAKVLFKRPAITETGERDRLTELLTKPRPAPTPGLIAFEAETVNIAPTPVSPTAEGDVSPDERMNLHYVTMGFSLEIADYSRRDEVEELRPRIMDQLLSILGRKNMNELTTVQGRYLLRSQIADLVNRLVSGEGADGGGENGASHGPRPHEMLVTNVYFTQFIAQ
jgi:flagellar basal body-associated protein FliL